MEFNVIPVNSVHLQLSFGVQSPTNDSGSLAWVDSVRKIQDSAPPLLSIAFLLPPMSYGANNHVTA